MPAPWTARVHERTLIVAFPTSYRVLSWAPLNGGLVEARTILNHQVDIHASSVLEPQVYLAALEQSLGVESLTVGLMTGVLIERLVRTTLQVDAVTLECFATVGLSNALAVSDPATYSDRPGTINIIVACNHPLAPPALVEAIQIVTEAKVQALYAAKIRSTVSDTFATGTGTDCVAVACPPGAPTYQYCGKHTHLGELLGRVVGQTMEEGLRRAEVKGI
jgi:adenosylcobinamide amidohydrolase